MKTTDMLDSILENAGQRDIDSFLSENRDKLTEGDRPFAAYMREELKKLGIRQQEVFLAADISEGYGYKLISEEKHTVRRDVIIRLCLGAGFDLARTQKALKLYGMSPLYSRIPRDAVMIIAFNTGVHDPREVDELLKKHDMEPLYQCRL